MTIGGGVILDSHLPKLSRGTRGEILETLSSGTLEQRVELMAKLEGLRGITIEAIQARTGFTTATLRSRLRNLPHLATIADGRWMHIDTLAEFRRRAIEFLDRYFKQNRVAVNVAKSEFVQKMIPSSVDATLTGFLLADLAKERIAELRGDALEIPGRSKTLGGTEGELARAIEKRFADAGLQPPPVSQLIQTMPQKPKMIEGVIAFLVKQGTLIRLADGVYVHSATIASAREKIAEKKGETIDVGQFKELFGLSRKVAIPLLEFFDSTGVTKRVGDARRVL